MQQALGDEGRLLVRVAAGDQRWVHSGAMTGCQLLLELAGVAPNAGIGELQDLRNGPVVDLQLEDLGARIALREPEDVVVVRTAKCVDALTVVANHHQVAAVLDRERLDDLALHEIGVLVFVDEDVAELLSVLAPEFRVLAKQS